MFSAKLRQLNPHFANTLTLKILLSTERKYLELKAGTRKPGFCFCVT